MNRATQMTSDFEQIETAMSQVAIVVAGYHKDLVKSGMSQAQAMKLTEEFNRQWLSVLLKIEKKNEQL